MRHLDISRKAHKFISGFDAKQFRQVVSKMLDLLNNPEPADSGRLKGYDYERVDFGEYRIVYHFDADTVYVLLVGKRNDDEVYKDLSRL